MAELQMDLDTTIRPTWASFPYNTVAVGSYIYIMTGNASYQISIYRYDTINKIMTEMVGATFVNPEPSTYRNMIYKDGYIYAIRGGNSTFTTAYIDRYSIADNSLEIGYYSANTYSPRPYFWSVIDDKFVCAASSTSSTSKMAEIIDPVNKTYYTSTPTLAPYLGQITDGYFFSRYSYAGQFNTCGRITLSGNTVVTTELLNHSYDLTSCVTFKEGNIVYVVKGSSIYEYDTETNQLSLVQGVTVPSAGGQYPLATYVNDTAYIFGTSGLLTIKVITYDLTYDIKNNDGSETMATFLHASPITSVRFNFSGSGDVGIVLTTITGTLTQNYTPVVPEGYTVTGFAASANSTIINYPLNTELPVSIVDDFSFYEVYNIYNPPDTPLDVNLYQCTAENNRVDKTSFLTPVGTLSGALRDECSMIAPSLVIEYDHAPDFNYVYISAFSRYFFVIGITSVRKNLWRIDLKCDVLMTYASGILALSAYVARNENDYNDDLVDTQLPAQNDPTVIRQEIPNAVLSNQLTTEHNYVLTVVGAAEPPAPTP